MKLCNIPYYLGALINHFIPRNKHLWITGKTTGWGYENSPPMFFDNSKYFFLYLVNCTQEKVFWICDSEKEVNLLKSMGLPAVNYHSIKGKWLVARAEYSFHHYGINQLNRILQFGSIQINFWHGIPLKKIGYDVNPRPSKQPNILSRYLNKNGEEYLLSSSEYLSKEIYQKAFDIDLEHILDYGYPRTDVLKLNREQMYSFCDLYARNLKPYLETIRGRKVYLYMPTYRDYDDDYFVHANIDFSKLDNVLDDNNSILFLKLHPLTKRNNIRGYKNIVEINNDVDMYPFLCFTDYLITDYSSIYFDFLLLDKEMFFIPYDLEEYMASRELYFEYDSVVPGKVFKSFDEFIDSIPLSSTYDYSEKRKEIKDKFISNYNFDACEKTYTFLKEMKQ